MSFTYDDDLTADIDRVRLSLNDVEEKKGPRPANKNFSNEEINHLLSIEDSWRLAVAAGFELLASAWAKDTSFSVVNGSFTRSEAAKMYADLAKKWRDKYGESADAPKRPRAIPVSKVDYGLEPRETLT